MMRSACADTVSTGRRALCLLAGSTFVRLWSQESVTVVYANERWYRDRAEVEREFAGLLRNAPPQEGPNTRTSLRFTLQSGNRSRAVYAAGVMDTLAPFADKRVVVRAKLVNLRAEGHGEELWIGTIKTRGR